MNLEADFNARYPVPETAQAWVGESLEWVRPRGQVGFPRVALFDFDGTLSLIREGWPDVMIPMMVEALQETGTSETAAELTSLVSRFVHELTGKQTLYQMIRLCDEIARRGGTSREPQWYKDRYHEALLARIETRREALRSGTDSPDRWLVPGSRELLEGLMVRGVELYLASGTDIDYVREEARLLGIAEMFGPRIYGALPDVSAFSKEQVIRSILTEMNDRNLGLIGFGDGYVEIDNLVSVGALAIGVASDEKDRSGRVDPWKRRRLIGVGAHLIVPDYREHRQLLEHLFQGKW